MWTSYLEAPQVHRTRWLAGCLCLLAVRDERGAAIDRVRREEERKRGLFSARSIGRFLPRGGFIFGQWRASESMNMGLYELLGECHEPPGHFKFCLGP